MVCFILWLFLCRVWERKGVLVVIFDGVGVVLWGRENKRCGSASAAVCRVADLCPGLSAKGESVYGLDVQGRWRLSCVRSWMSMRAAHAFYRVGYDHGVGQAAAQKHGHWTLQQG